jgi:uncharacterized protein (DUF952 family)
MSRRDAAVKHPCLRLAADCRIAPPMDQTIYKVLTAGQWASAKAGGPVEAPVDVADGYVHFSTAAQLQGTLSKWFKGQTGCVLLAFDSDDFGPALKWEKGRDGELFPHVYDRVLALQVRANWNLATGSDGAPLAPQDIPGKPGVTS